MWWRKDDLADELIAKNTARPRPGMEKPDMDKLEMSRHPPPKKAVEAIEQGRIGSSLILDDDQETTPASPSLDGSPPLLPFPVRVTPGGPIEPFDCGTRI